MPTYDYECTVCGHRFEKFQPITARPVRRCPVCGKRKVHRLIGTGAGVIFKGGGFYQTDYRSESYRKAAEKDKSAASGGGSSETSGKSSSESTGKAASPAKDKAAPKDS